MTETTQSIFMPAASDLSLQRQRALVNRLNWLACLPIMMLAIAPYGRIKISPGYINFHDALLLIFLVYAHQFTAKKNRNTIYIFLTVSAQISFAIGFFSTIIRYGPNLRLYLYFFEYVLYLYYAKRLYDLSRAGLINPRRIASAILYGSAASASFGIMQYITTFFSPKLAAMWLNAYYKLFSIPTDYTLYLNLWMGGHLARITGPWLHSITYGAMLLVGLTFLPIADIKAGRKVTIAGIIIIPIILTGTRHVWLGLLLLFLNYLLGGKISLTRRAKSILTVGIAVGILALFSSFFKSGESSISTVDEILNNRLGRTFEQGLKDSSFTARFIKGPKRFYKAIKDDPSIILFGSNYSGKFSVRKSDPLYDMGNFVEESGFASNSFLLMITGTGILGFVAIVGMHLFPLQKRYRNLEVLQMLSISSLLWVFDNYVFVFTRIFMFMMVLMAFAWIHMNVHRPYKRPQLIKGKIEGV